MMMTIVGMTTMMTTTMWPLRRDSGIPVTILLENGGVETNASGSLTSVNVEIKLFVGKSPPAIIAAPAPAALRTEARYHVQGVKCWTSVSLVRTEGVIPAITAHCT